MRLAVLGSMHSILLQAGLGLGPGAWRILLAVLQTAAAGSKTEVQEGYATGISEIMKLVSANGQLRLWEAFKVG